jgi:hypothetical protein
MFHIHKHKQEKLVSIFRVLVRSRAFLKHLRPLNPNFLIIPSTYMCSVSYQTFVMSVKCYDGYYRVDFLKDPNYSQGLDGWGV